MPTAKQIMGQIEDLSAISFYVYWQLNSEDTPRAAEPFLSKWLEAVERELDALKNQEYIAVTKQIEAPK